MRVIVVDDDAIVVRSLSTILGAEPDIEVAGTGTSGEGGPSRSSRRASPTWCSWTSRCLAETD